MRGCGLSARGAAVSVLIIGRMSCRSYLNLEEYRILVYIIPLHSKYSRFWQSVYNPLHSTAGGSPNCELAPALFQWSQHRVLTRRGVYSSPATGNLNTHAHCFLKPSVCETLHQTRFNQTTLVSEKTRITVDSCRYWKHLMTNESFLSWNTIHQWREGLGPSTSREPAFWAWMRAMKE